MNVLDLFSGIGGFSLGLERAGMRTTAFCETEEYCRRVLAKHWPGVICYHDIRDLTAAQLAADGIPVDVITGGFPCQDISTAGRRAGISGERSGLWTEFARLVGELRPRYAIVENVAALLIRGLDVVLGDLAAIGYDAEWHCIPASAVGAPHLRDRIWIIAYPSHEVADPDSRRCEGVGLAQHDGQQLASGGEPDRRGAGGYGDRPAMVADANRPRLQGRLRTILQERPEKWAVRAGDTRWIGGTWLSEPDVRRVATRVPNRVDRLAALGNAAVPQVTEVIGRAIMACNKA